MTPQQVLRNTQGLPSVTFYSGTTPTDADAAVTVTITRGDGTVFASGAATTHPGATGLYQFTLAPQANLERFTFVWSGTFGGVAQSVTTQVEIVGGYVVSLADLLLESGLGSKTPEQLAEARQWFEERAEDYCSLAFVPRYAFTQRDGTGTARLELKRRKPRRLLSVTRDGTAETFTGWDLYDDGTVIRDSGLFATGRKNYAVAFEHGEDGADAAIREAAITAIRSRLLSDAGGGGVGGGIGGGIPANATQLVTDAGTVTLGRPSRPFGIAEVDDVLRERRPALVGY